MNLTQQKAQFETFLQSQTDEPRTVTDFRKDAFECFLEIGYPTKKQESWRYTNLSSLVKTKYQSPNGEASKIDNNIISDHSIENSHRIVFINGIFDTEFSSIDDIGKQITIRNISDSFGKLTNDSTENNANPFILAIKPPSPS